MNYNIICILSAIITISGCLIYSERLYVREFKLKGAFWLFIGLADIAGIGKFAEHPYGVMGICCVLPIIYLAYDIIRNYRVPRCKIPRYNWCCWLMAGLFLVALYWNSGGDLAGFQ